MKRTFLLALAVLVAAVPAAFADGISMQICYAVAPNAYGSPSFPGYAANAMIGLENGCTAEGDPNSPTGYTPITSLLASELMVTSFLSWAGQVNPTGAFANEEGSRLEAGLIVLGNGTQFSLSELNYSMQSSDPGNGLGFVGDFDASDVYSDYRVGVIYGPGGSATYVTSGSATQLVDAFYYVGIGNAFWPCVDDLGNSTCFTTGEEQAGLDATVAYINGNGGNPGQFTVGMTYSLVDSGGNTLASVTADISETPEPAAVLLMGSGLLALAGFAHGRRRR